MILVTGAAGYIANHFIPLIKDTPPDEILLLDRSDEVLKVAEQNFIPEENVILSCFSEADRFLSKTNIPSKITHVVHLAEERLEDLNNEFDFTHAIEKQKKFYTFLETLPDIKKIVLPSSCSVYGDSKDKISEVSEVRPTSYYAKIKIAVESLTKNLNKKFVIARFGTAYGVSSPMREDLFINMLTKNSYQGTQIDVFGVDAWRAYVHTKDFARFLYHALFDDELTGLINVAQINLTKRMIFEELKQITKESAHIKLSDRVDPRNYYVLSTNPEFTKFKFMIDFKAGLSELCQYYGSNQSHRAK